MGYAYYLDNLASRGQQKLGETLLFDDAEDFDSDIRAAAPASFKIGNIKEIAITEFMKQATKPSFYDT